MDLERQLAVSVVIESSSGLGVRLEAHHLRELLSPGWMAIVTQHFRFPQSPGMIREMNNLEMKCTRINDRDPALKIATVDDDGRHMYVILGEVSCKLLFMYAPAILYRVNAYTEETMRVTGWLRDCLKHLVNLAYLNGFGDGLTVQAANNLICSAADKLSNAENAASLHWETEFQFDMLYRHREYLASLLIEMMKCDPDEEL